MNRELEKLKERIAVEKKAQQRLLEATPMLMGFAWNNAREYARSVQIPLLEMTYIWIEAEMAGNEAYKTAASRLPQVNCLDEDQLKRHIHEWQKEIRYEKMDEYPNHRLIARLQGYIKDAYAKLDAMSTFVCTTRSIYDKAGDILCI